VGRDVKTLTNELAQNPDSMVFLELAETLRVRGQLHGAAKVLVAGLTRHPGSADAHDMYARVLVDMGHLRHGYEEWVAAVEANPRHVGARKGLGFLCFRWGDLDGALEHLETALSADPMDPSVVQALRMVRDAAENVSVVPEEEIVPGVFDGLEGAQRRRRGCLGRCRCLCVSGCERSATNRPASRAGILAVGGDRRARGESPLEPPVGREPARGI
jgi:tetratricopeptide (TPR) repeat protein